MSRVAADAPERAPGASRLAVGDEPDLYEALRRGDEQAFTTLVARYDPLLRRLAAVYRPGGRSDEAGAWHARVSHDAWTTALDGLDTFEWRCSLGAWVVGIFVAQARGVGGGGGAGRVGAGASAPQAVELAGSAAARFWTAPGIDEWRDLPWGARWAGVWAVTRGAVTALPLGHREVLWLHDVEALPCLDVREVAGVTDARHRRLVGEARTSVALALARLADVGAAGGPARPGVSDPPPGCAAALAGLADGTGGCHLAGHLRAGSGPDGHAAGCAACAAAVRRLAATLGVLDGLRPDDVPAGVDPDLLRAFRRWRRRRLRRERRPRATAQSVDRSAGARRGWPPRAARTSAPT